MFPHEFAFDPTYGYAQSELLAIRPPTAPDGFESFWRETYKLALAVNPEPVLRQIASPRSDLELYEVEYTGLDGFRVGGWFTRPADGKVARGVVVGHGYGGRDAADTNLPGAPAAAIFPCARGFHRSARPDLPGSADKHVIRGIDARETYIHRFCIADLWSAVSALIALAPEIAGRIDYMGTSFGGGVGAMALPWEPRFKRAFLGVPSFGHHPIRLTIPCVGSGESVRQFVQNHPETARSLAFFDSAIHAQFCRIPVMVSCALFDPAVPPPGQFAVYNALAGQKKLFVRKSDHFAWSGTPGEERNLYREQTQWFE